jgi:hypothetical protein
LTPIAMLAAPMSAERTNAEEQASRKRDICNCRHRQVRNRCVSVQKSRHAHPFLPIGSLEPVLPQPRAPLL